MLLTDWLWRLFGYSFLGWLMETIIFTIEERRWVNRGFLTGPICPIYGCGAILILVTLQPLLYSWPLLLLAGILLTTVLEYLTSWLMEKLFHARWWDYSDKPLNLHGRITLLHSLTWGTFCLLLVYGLDPMYARLLAGIPLRIRETGALLALIIMLIDLVVTVIGAVNLNRQLARLQEMTRTIRLKNSEFGENIQQRLAFLAASFRELRKEANMISGVQRRLLEAFPRLRSIHYQDTLKKLRHWLKKSRLPQVWPVADITMLRSQNPIMSRRKIRNVKPGRVRRKPGSPD